MQEKPKYFLVEAEALPEVFRAVAEAKRLIQTGEAATVGDAARMTGISRSAYYKYRDSVLPFETLMAGHILTFQFMLKDRAGVLSAILSILAECGANILTINQTIPSGGCAMVTISAATSSLKCTVESMIAQVDALADVIRSEIVAG